MAETKVSDILIPEVWQSYMLERTAEKSDLIRSGIVQPDPLMNILASRGGNQVDLPFFQDLSGNSEVLTDGASLTAQSISVDKDIARLQLRAKAWGSNELAYALAGSDPLEAIANLLAEWWNRDEQDLLIASLKGVFADNVANNSSDLVNDITVSSGDYDTDGTDDNLISSDAIIDTKVKLGDSMNKLTGIMIHSTPYSRLQKLNLIDFEPTNTQNIGFGTYLGHTLLVNDNMPTASEITTGTEYTTWLFGIGAVARGEGNTPVGAETDRDSLAGIDYLINRRHYILHPRGIRWDEGSITAAGGHAPNNTDLANAANWTRVYEKKNIRIAQLLTNG